MSCKISRCSGAVVEHSAFRHCWAPRTARTNVVSILNLYLSSILRAPFLFFSRLRSPKALEGQKKEYGETRRREITLQTIRIDYQYRYSWRWRRKLIIDRIPPVVPVKHLLQNPPWATLQHYYIFLFIENEKIIPPKPSILFSMQLLLS